VVPPTELGSPIEVSIPVLSIDLQCSSCLIRNLPS
jgi:hypothetical protein